jgi:hypothetical protein
MTVSVAGREYRLEFFATHVEVNSLLSCNIYILLSLFLSYFILPMLDPLFCSLKRRDVIFRDLSVNSPLRGSCQSERRSVLSFQASTLLRTCREVLCRHIIGEWVSSQLQSRKTILCGASRREGPITKRLFPSPCSARSRVILFYLHRDGKWIRRAVRWALLFVVYLVIRNGVEVLTGDFSASSICLALRHERRSERWLRFFQRGWISRELVGSEARNEPNDKKLVRLLYDATRKIRIRARHYPDEIRRSFVLHPVAGLRSTRK